MDTVVRNAAYAPVAAHTMDKGIPTSGLLAQVLMAKYVDHLPLYGQEGIFAHASLAISRSTLAAWVVAADPNLTSFGHCAGRRLTTHEYPGGLAKPH